MKMDRLLAITILLLNRERISAKELADRFEVSTKTIYRDIDTLCQSGIPIAAHQGTAGGFEIMEQYTIGRQFLSLKEIAALIAAVQGAASALDDGMLEHLLEKVKALLRQSDRVDGESRGTGVIFDFNPWGQSAAARKKINTLKQAIESSLRVNIQYSNRDGSESERVIEPCNLILKGDLWYVQAYCTLKEDYRVFRLSRIQGLQLTTEHFAPREIPPLERYGWDSEWSKEKEQEMTLTFHPKVRYRVEDTYPADLIRILEDGSVQVKGKFIGDEWFYGNLLSYGDGVKVEQPLDVAKEIRRRAQKIMECYSNLDI
ncbi:MULTISPECIES: helix-turn-helix transcriptional regulator [Paenibacillus]|uniref:helix-turn-helix transcriptional regulator n=1 Tax=Paenibacillus TaxID=44249 RepID=UPI0022B91568|nr:YafY family protein [Paenibacillus caseinilyticus]MCZ8522032.1 YafY family protein [Paenibacillus caseinilyticus]